ncbi:MAG: tRNA dihydrouridine synthase DusB [Phototrophicaceae bacterium]
MPNPPQPNHPLLQPLNIGNVTLPTHFFLAPMAGQTNYAFRKFCRDYGGIGLVCTELISSAAMQYTQARERTFQKFDWVPADESPVAVQLFGADPYQMAEAAKIVADHGADIVDINMGCWVPKVAKTGGGAKLLTDVDTATRVVEAVVNAVNIPVTVKVRAGWEKGNPTALPFAKAAEAVGVKLIAVHWRFATMGFKGEPVWDIIRQVKETVSIPVIGNGDVHSAADALRMVEQTGCDGVMVGRAALGQPWWFRDAAYEIAHGQTAPPIAFAEQAHTALEQARLTLETTQRGYDEQVRMLRGQLSHYCKGVPGIARIRDAVVRAESFADIERALAPLFAENAATDLQGSPADFDLPEAEEVCYIPQTEAV